MAYGPQEGRHRRLQEDNGRVRGGLPTVRPRQGGLEDLRPLNVLQVHCIGIR